MDVFDILDLLSSFGSRRNSESCPKRRKSSLHYLEERRGYNKEGDYPPLFSLSTESKNIFNKLSKNKSRYQVLFDTHAIILGQYVSHTDEQEDKDNVKQLMFEQRIEDLSKCSDIEFNEKDIVNFIKLADAILKKEMEKIEEDRELYYYVKNDIKKENLDFCNKYLYSLKNEPVSSASSGS